MNNIKLIALFLLLCNAPLHSQVKLNYQHLTTADGLSQGLVFDIMQSRDGFIWVCTKDGLNRYDGSRFKVFSPDPFDPFSIVEGYANGLYEDSRGWIWIHFLTGTDVLDPQSGRFFHLMKEGKPVISPLFEDRTDGTIWCLQDDNRLLKFSIQKDMLEKAFQQGNANIEPPCKTFFLPAIKDESGNPIRAVSLLFTKNYKPLVATSHGLWRLNQGSEKMDLMGYTTLSINRLMQDTEGKIWMDVFNKNPANRNGSQIIIWDEQAGMQQGQIMPGAYFAWWPFDGALWIIQDNTLKRYQPQRYLNKEPADIQWPFETFFPQYKQGRINKLFLDKSGMIWIGTDGFGMVKINPQNPTFRSYLPNISQRKIFETPEGKLLTSAELGTLYHSIYFDQNTPDQSLSSLHHGYTPPLTVLYDRDGNCWSYAFDSLLYRRDARTRTLQAFPLKGRGLCLDAKNKILSVSSEGLHMLDPATGQTRLFAFKTPQQQRSEFSHFFWKDAESTIWIFGFEGLVKAIPSDADGYQFEYFVNNPKDRASLSSNTVLSAADDPLEPNRYLWLGTKAGLNRLDKKTGEFKQYSIAQGLPDNVVYGVLAENMPKGSNRPGFIWLSTNKGLCRFDVRAETTKNFTVADGLQDNEFNSSSYLKTSNGTLIFGGIKGLTVFHPDSLRFNPFVPQTRIVGLHVNNQPYDISGQSSITLTHNQNLLTFDFAALEFTNPAQNLYRYQLVGVDEDWVSLGLKNNIQFANLAPGTYTFKVLGSNNAGIWSDQPAELRFTIRPPWWASWWAWLLYLGILAAGAWRYYQYLLNRRLSAQEKLRLTELDDFKTRFFTNITHEFRTPLTVMLGMSEQLAKDETDDPKRNKLGLIKRSGENLLRLINQILDLAKLESNTLKMNYIQGDILTFIQYVTESLHSLANAQNLMLRVESEQSKIVIDYDPERFLQIIHNLLSNAIKFTPSGGKVVIRADVKDRWLHISVADSGAGIPPEELPHLFERFFQARNQEHAKAGGTGIGLSLTRELVKAMGGEISVESTVGVGSTFLVRLPITNHSALVAFGSNVKMEAWKPSLAKPQITRPEESVQSHPLTAPTVLLVEDNPDVVEYLSACLKEHYYLDFAYNGKAGIDMALENVPDLIVSDVMMPYKDGFEVLENLKNDERTSHIPIVLLTAKADTQSRLAGLRKGADAYLSKPFHQEELLVILENLLESRRKLQAKYQQNVLSTTAPSVEEPDPEDSFLLKVRAVVEKNLSDADFEMPHLERALAMSRSQIFRKIKALTGKSPSLFIRSIRLHHGKQMLQNTALTVSEIAYEVGFSSLNYFSDAFFEEFGERPLKVRGGG
ncbi:MAG: response regulator [Saprospiraceae bacterium]|nr:response regulator [Saprospiraceae bacterium]MCC6281557.1 response regulator [Saprospiraceae bacterium]